MNKIASMSRGGIFLLHDAHLEMDLNAAFRIPNPDMYEAGLKIGRTIVTKKSCKNLVQIFSLEKIC